MKQFWSLAGRGLYKLMGWTFDPAPEYLGKKHVIIGFPHTSNMDTVRAFAGYRIIKRTGCIMVKKEAFWWPLSVLLRALGGIPVDRHSPKGVVAQMADVFRQRDEFLLAIVPEGTRKGTRSIRTGFWHIAKEADVSIVLWFLDNRNKAARWLGEVKPGADKMTDLLLIRDIYTKAGYTFPFEMEKDK